MIKKTYRPSDRRPLKPLSQAEEILWSFLERYHYEGSKFLIHQQVGEYQVTFANFQKRIIIELNGQQPLKDKEAKAAKDKYLKLQGYKVMRFWDNDIIKNMPGVLDYISKNL
ncbi:MAG: hypothetical protein A2252_06430 [Elusimicrobia bacterium RIFOXYA2_FULL_39_19]|nr:MAG: hypothetical protein A2252_06430 [Elusimicrobia bacterium RIFOXYA2_FULL_39_19]